MCRICYVVTVPLSIRSFFIPQLHYLSSNGFEVTVICSDDGKIRGELGGLVKYIPVEIPRGISILGSLKAIKKLKRIFRKEQFDIIQYSTPNAALYASIAAKKVDCKIRNYHMMGLRYLGTEGVGRVVLKAIEKFVCYNSTFIECVSNSNLELALKEKLFTKEKAIVVWNGSTGGVDLQKFDYTKRLQWRKEIRSKLGYSEDSFVYGFVGRITKDKGIDELLEAFYSLKGDNKLLLVGPTEGMETLNQNLLNKSKQDTNIIFYGAVTDVERYYAAIDVLVLPSYREGFGNVVIEAGAMGTPAIVSDIPGPIDAISNGHTALTVEAKNVYDLIEKMTQIKLLNYKSMGDAAAKYSRDKFDSIKLCEKILERKKELLENGLSN